MNDQKQSILDSLGFAISDFGIWNWWTADFPNAYQLEFDRAMIYVEPKTEDQAPSNKIALQFLKPSHVLILKTEDFSLEEDWKQRFHKDQAGPFALRYEYFAFHNDRIMDILDLAGSMEAFRGENFSKDLIVSSPIKLAFWADYVGILVLAEDLKFCTLRGEILLEDLPTHGKQWWDYWTKYCELIEPYDPLCEITIPAGKPGTGQDEKSDSPEESSKESLE
jgi:hypothetical protein